jgi:hypothetical protein
MFPALPWIVMVVIDGVTFELIKAGTKWVFRTPPPLGKRPAVIYDAASGYNFYLQSDGSYLPKGSRQV